MNFKRQLSLPLVYKGLRLEYGYRVDLVVAKTVVVEIKCVASIEPVHEAQLMTYLRIGRWPVGLIINFHVPVLRSGIKRIANLPLPVSSP